MVLGICISPFIFSQSLNQTVRGTLRDADSQLPLVGASIWIPGTEPVIGTTSDREGNFRLEKVPVGRILLKVSYLGYESITLPNIVVNSAKEVVLELQMEESVVKMEEVVILANENKGEALNEMSLISSRSISAEQTNRFAGGFNDPSRIISNFAGVTSTQDGSNDIIVRGNSPKYVQWRLEGIQITNPNHFADQSAVGGAVSTLNNNLLATSDFHTGAFAPEFGDVLSGVYDVKLRAGNNEKFESVFGLGILGVDLTLEGPFKKGYKGSYLVNYRYSTAALIGELGLVDIEGIPRFQDAAFKVVLPTDNAGVFSLFGLGGQSGFEFEDITPEFWETPGNRGMRAEIREDYHKSSFLYNTGLNHSLPLSKNSFLKTTLAFSQEGIDDDIFEERLFIENDGTGEVLEDSVLERQGNFSSRLKKSTLRGALTYNLKLNAKHKLQIGTKFARFDYDFIQSQFQEDPSARNTLVDFKEQIHTLRNFVSWKYRINEDITLVSGFHNMNVLFNNRSTLEPRMGLNWKLSPKNILSLGYGSHSTMESIHNYFARIEGEGGRRIEPNRDLDLLKAHHYVMGFERRLSKIFEQRWRYTTRICTTYL